MAELDFYFNKKEKKELISFLLESECKFIPDDNTELPSYITLQNIEEIEPYLEGNIKFFIIHNDYTFSNFEMREFKKEGRTKYYISQKYGGPAMDIYLNGIAEKKDIVATGNISIYSYYIINGENIKASVNLRSFYEKVVKYIKKRSKVFRFTKRSVWIGNENNQEEIAAKLFP